MKGFSKILVDSGNIIHDNSDIVINKYQGYRTIITAFVMGGVFFVTLVLMAMGWFNVETINSQGYREGQIACLSGDMHYDLQKIEDKYVWVFVPSHERWRLRHADIRFKTILKEIADLRREARVDKGD